MNYYTIQIHYNSFDDSSVKVEERKDMNCGTMEEAEWVRVTREKLFSSGFHIATAPGCYEFVAPYRIVRAYLVRQPGKMGI